MANLVLKSNTANNTFQVQQKVFKCPFVKNKIQLTITPQKLYSINSKDFNVGILPPLVSKVEFENLGDKIIASIFIKQEIISSKNIILDIPITGKGFLKIDRFNIIEKVKTNGEVLITNLSPYPRSVVDNETKYIIKNNLGKKSLVLSKTFTVTEDFKFTKLPAYNISGNSNQYNVTTKIKKDKNNNVISKTFDFYYTSPNAVAISKDTQISFSVSTNYSSKQTYAEGITKVSKNKIYSIDKGRDLGSQGGTKRMVVKGAPGSTFSFLVSNAAGAMYDRSSGSFSDSGGIITGVIPKAVKGKSFGESVIRINIPRSAAAQTISTQFFKQEDVAVQKAKLAQATTTAEIDKIQGEGKIKKAKSLSLTTPTLTFNITMDSATLASTAVVAAEAKLVSTSSVTLTVDDGSGGDSAATDALFLNKKIYKSDGTLFGTCTSVTNATTLVFGDGISGAIANNDVLYAYPTTYLGPKVKIISRGTTATSQLVFLGEENRKELNIIKPGVHKFSFTVSAAVDNKVVQITRQPLFVMPTAPEDNYVAWDSDATKKILAQQADGTKIPSDWDWSSVESNTSVDMQMKCLGLGKVLSTDAISGVDHYSYAQIQVVGEIRVGNVGEVSSNLSLNLDNFLSVITPS